MLNPLRKAGVDAFVEPTAITIEGGMVRKYFVDMVALLPMDPAIGMGERESMHVVCGEARRALHHPAPSSHPTRTGGAPVSTTIATTVDAASRLTYRALRPPLVAGGPLGKAFVYSAKTGDELPFPPTNYLIVAQKVAAGAAIVGFLLTLRSSATRPA